MDLEAPSAGAKLILLLGPRSMYGVWRDIPRVDSLKGVAFALHTKWLWSVSASQMLSHSCFLTMHYEIKQRHFACTDRLQTVSSKIKCPQASSSSYYNS